MKKIPLNSLVFPVDFEPGRSKQLFPAHEIVTLDSVKYGLVGCDTRPDLRDMLIGEVERLTFMKLALGQRVVVDVPELKKEARISMARTAHARGHSVFLLVTDLDTRKELSRGDNILDVIDIEQFMPNVVLPLPDNNFFAEIANRGFHGITVVPDIHGMMNQLQNVIDWATRRNHFLLFCGDLIDYGQETLPVLDTVYHLVTRGLAEALMGNHERKIYRYLSQIGKGSSTMRLSAGNKVTIDKLNSLSKGDRERWVGRFNALVSLMRNHRVSDNFIFAHGAVMPELWETTAFRVNSTMEGITLFGEVDDSVKRADNYPNRVYNWVDLLLPHQTAIVGHDIRSEMEPLKHKGALGGTAIFMDTGCGKGGHLSSLDIRFTAQGPKIENFSIH